MADPQAAELAHAAIWARFDAIEDVNTYDGVVPKTPPLDPGGPVHAYAVLYMGPGDWRSTTLGDKPRQLAGTGQVTCVGGDPQRALWCVGRIRAALPGVVTVGGHDYRLRLREGDPGPVRRDDTVKPVRHWVPLELSIFIP